MDRKKLIGSATRYIVGRHALQTTYWRKPVAGGKGMVKTTRLTFFGKNEGPDKVDSAEMFAKIKKKAIIIEEKKKDDKDTQKPKIEKPKKPKVPKLQKVYVPKYLVKSEGDDAKKYDYGAERPDGHKAKFCESTFHLVSNSLGVCLFCTNELYVANGLVSGVIITVFLGCVMSYSLCSVTNSAHQIYGITQVPFMTYPDLAQASMDICTFPVLRKYGGKFKHAVIATIFMRKIAKCLIYQLVLARNLENMLFKNRNLSPADTRKYLGVLLIPCTLISMLRTVEYTAPFAMVSHVFMLLLVVYILALGTKSATNRIEDYEIIYSARAFFSFIGGCMFTMDPSAVLLPVENSMKEPKYMPRVVILGMFIVTVLVATVGFVGGYYQGGFKTVAPITVNFSGMPYAAFFRIGVCLSAYLYFALDFFVLFNFVWELHLKKLHTPERYWIFERLYRAGIVVGICVFACMFPDVSGIMSLFGAITDSTLNFIYAPLIEFLVSTRGRRFGKYKWKVIRFVAITTLGWILTLGGIVTGFMDIFRRVY